MEKEQKLNTYSNTDSFVLQGEEQKKPEETFTKGLAVACAVGILLTPLVGLATFLKFKRGQGFYGACTGSALSFFLYGMSFLVIASFIVEDHLRVDCPFGLLVILGVMFLSVAFFITVSTVRKLTSRKDDLV
jgi:hypothetical protein